MSITWTLRTTIRDTCGMRDVENGYPLQEIEVFFVPRRLARKEKTPLERGFAYDAV